MKSKNKRKGNIIRKIIFIIALVVFIGSGYKLFTIWNEYHKNEVVYDEIKEKFGPEKVVDKGGEEKYKFTQEDYDGLLAINSDFKGWIYVPNTNVDYPIVQSKDNDYYLHHNFYNEYNDGGAIFIASEIENPFADKNTIIHGHHMNDGSMFASLKEFKDSKEFFDKNRKIYITTKDDVLVYEIFSVYYQVANTDPYKYGFASDEDYVNFLNGLKEKSLYSVDMEPFTKDDKIVTLSTCTYEVNDGRLLVHGRLIQN